MSRAVVALSGFGGLELPWVLLGARTVKKPLRNHLLIPVRRYETRVAAFCLTNVTEWDSQVALFEFSYATFGPRIDYFFANAGIAQMREIRSSDPTHFASAQINDLATLAGNPPNLSVVRVNLDGVLYSLYAALAYFRKQEKDSDGWRGKFVATGSNA